jgi:hypothetical protein
MSMQPDVWQGAKRSVTAPCFPPKKGDKVKYKRSLLFTALPLSIHWASLSPRGRGG